MTFQFVVEYIDDEYPFYIPDESCEKTDTLRLSADTLEKRIRAKNRKAAIEKFHTMYPSCTVVGCW